MATRTCTNCGSILGDEDFCPDCGQWVEDESTERFTLNDERAAPSAYNSVPCPSCGAENPSHNRHCEQCGARLAQGALPVAPQPMIQSSAGVRAAMAIGAVLLFVVLAAFAFSFFNNDPDPVDSTLAADATDPTATTVGAVVQSPIEIIQVLNADCSSELVGFLCENMFDGDDETAWNDNSLSGEGAVITVDFAETYQLEQIIIKNLTDEVRFRRNFRIAGYKITTNDNTQGLIGVLDDEPGSQLINFNSLRTTRVIIEVESIHPGETVNDLEPFDELVVAEIEFYGRPVSQ